MAGSLGTWKRLKCGGYESLEVFDAAPSAFEASLFSKIGPET
jgi:hypothetical protein